MFKFIFRFIADVIVATIITLVILFITKSNLTIITTDDAKHEFYIQNPRIAENGIVVADMLDNVDEIVSEEEINEQIK